MSHRFRPSGWCLALALAGWSATAAPADLPERFSEHRDARHDRLLFLRNDAARVTREQAARRAAPKRPATLPVFDRAELNSPAWSNDVATARQFLARHGARFAERSGDSAERRQQTPAANSPTPSRDAATPTFSPDTDLALLTAERDQLGMTHVRFQQTHRGLPVFGTELTVHLDAAGRVSSAGGALAPDLAVDPTPTLTGEQAGLLAAALLQAQTGRPETPEARPPRLCVLAPGLLRNDGDPAAWLVWEVRVVLQDCTTDCDPLADETFYLDAHTATLREQMTGFCYLDRAVYDCAYWPGDTVTCQLDSISETLNYVFGRSEGQPARGPCPQYRMNGIFLGSQDTDRLYDYLGLIHNYYLTNFNRDGGNARGGIGNGTDLPWTTTKGNTHTQGHPVYANGCPASGGTSWNNYGSIRFCLGMVVSDVVAHEYAHSIPFFSHYDELGKPVGMAYLGTRETGALQESYCDLFGEVMDRLVTGTNDWLFSNSSNCAMGIIRNLSDPASLVDGYHGGGTSYPDRYGGPTFYCATNDVYGFYHNTGIPTKAAYLLAEGGLFNGCTIQPIGLDRVAQIWYRAMTQYYGTTETYNGAYLKLIQSAADLYGADSAEVRQVTRALQAVELDQPGGCSALPARVPAALDIEGW